MALTVASSNLKTVAVDTEQLLQTSIENENSLFSGMECSLSIAIPNYDKKLQSFYGVNLIPNFGKVIQRSGIPFNLKHLGLIINFKQPQELQIHNDDMVFNEGWKELIEEFGGIIIKNAFLGSVHRDMGHRNRFPHLSFHRDRNHKQPTPYSIYTRNPFDDEQRKPRISSTLFIANIVAYLQCMKERSYEQIKTRGVKSHYNIFKSTDMTQLLNNVVLEHRWDAPENTGEISMLDNRVMLHASYYRENLQPGYRIGVRYVS